MPTFFRHTKSEAVHAKPKVLMNGSMRNTKSEAVHTKPKVLMNGSMSNTKSAQMAGQVVLQVVVHSD